jgi:hypothetical protein
MLTGSELDGFPMRVDIDDHDHTPNIQATMVIEAHGTITVGAE